MTAPKYALVFETKGNYSDPYVIYEQCNVQTGDHPILQPIAQIIHSRYDTIHRALMALGTLNDGEPVLLAYSTKPVDNSFTV